MTTYNSERQTGDMLWRFMRLHGDSQLTHGKVLSVVESVGFVADGFPND